MIVLLALFLIIAAVCTCFVAGGLKASSSIDFKTSNSEEKQKKSEKNSSKESPYVSDNTANNQNGDLPQGQLRVSLTSPEIQKAALSAPDTMGKSAFSSSHSMPGVTNSAPVEEKSNPGLNTLLYIGSFILISSLFYGLHTVDDALVPVAVIFVTIFSLVASLLIRKFVDFLKPASFAFNISSLIMFMFWFPSLEFYKIPDYFIFTIITGIMTIATFVSAFVFKNRAYWSVPGAFFMFFIFCLGTAIDMSINEHGSSIACYLCTLVFMAIGAVYHFIWRSRATWVPVEMRAAIRSYTYILTITAGFFALLGSFACGSHFCASIAIALGSIIAFTESRFNNVKISILLRIVLQLLIISVAIDTTLFLKLSSDGIAYIVVPTILASALVQGGYSCIRMFMSKDEKEHMFERVAISISIILCACVLIFCSGKLDGNSLIRPFIECENMPIPRFNQGVPICASAFSKDLFYLISGICSAVVPLILSAVYIFADRNSIALIPAMISLSTILISLRPNDEIISIVFIIIFTILALLCVPLFYLLKKVDEKSALQSCVISSTLLCLCIPDFYFYKCYIWIPLTACILGWFIVNRKEKQEALDYALILALAADLCLFWVDMRPLLNSSVAIALDNISIQIIPSAIMALGILHGQRHPKNDPATNAVQIPPLFLVGFILFIAHNFLAITANNFISDNYEGLRIAIFLTLQVAVALYAVMKKWRGVYITAFVTIIVRLVAGLQIKDIWIYMLILGMGIIGGVVYAFYRQSQKGQK